MTTLPPSLVRFEHELSGAIARDLRPRFARPRPRHLLRVSVAAAGAAAVALGILSALPGGGDPNVVARAAAAVGGSGDSILHVATVIRDTQGGGQTTWRIETWQELSAPFASREIRSDGGTRLETSTAGGPTQVYDAATNTIYTNPSGSYTKPGGADTGAPGGKQGAATSGGDPYRAKILAILQSGQVSAEGHATVDGRDALKLVSGDGSTTIYVDPQTYRPVEWSTPTETASFGTYEQLSRNAATEALLSLRAQHPAAHVDDSAAGYQAAVARLAGKR